MLSTLPKVLEEIIIDYKNQMDYYKNQMNHKEKFQSTINMINDIEYSIGEYQNGKLLLSSRELPNPGYMHNNYIEYYYNPFAVRKNRLIIETHHCFRGESVIYSKCIEKTIDGFIKIENQGVEID
jgi:hypothetical protein